MPPGSQKPFAFPSFPDFFPSLAYFPPHTHFLPPPPPLFFFFFSLQREIQGSEFAVGNLSSYENIFHIFHKKFKMSEPRRIWPRRSVLPARGAEIKKKSNQIK